MKNLFKKFVAVGLLVLFASSMFAEPASTGITDSDVKNWAKNLNPIVNELNKLGLWNDDSINATAKQKSSADAVLNKYGISGSNCIEKFGMISGCAVVLVSASELDAQSIAILKAMGMDPLEELKKNVNSKDYAVVEANSKAVVKAYQNLDTSSFDSGSSDASDDYSYGDAELADLYSRLGDAFAKQAAESGDRDPEHAEAIKKLYEQISKTKGDSGYIYKTKKSASKYKKTNYKKGTVLTKENGYGSDELTWSFDLDKKKAKLDFNWNKNSKTINYTITSIEYYYIKEDSDMGGESKEYVVATKEGPVFHFFDEWDFSGNAFHKQIGIKGVDFKSIADWNWEYNTWSDYN